MNEILVNIGGLSVYTMTFFVVWSYFWYGFVVYKKGLEYRYSPESLLDMSVLSGLFGWLGSRLFFVFGQIEIFRVNWLRVFLIYDYPGYDYLGLLVGLIGAVWWLGRRGEVKFFEGLDLIGLGLPGAMALERLGRVFSGDVNLVFGVPLAIFQAFLFLLIFVWLWRLESEYRTFGWYRFRRTQARNGFIFGAFLFLSGWEILLTYLWPAFNLFAVVLGAFSVLFGAVFVYRRSGRSLEHDVKLLPLINRWYTRSK